MTLIATWLDQKKQFLWTISDTLLSKSAAIPGGVLPLLTTCSKVLQIEIKCLSLQTFPSKYYYSTHIGFGFAGSSLIGLQIFSFTNFSLKNINCHNRTVPSLEEIATHFSEVFRSVLQDYGNVNFEFIDCTIIFFGFCKKEDQFILFNLTPSWNEGNVEINKTRINFVQEKDDYIHCIGNNEAIEEYKQLVKIKRENIFPGNNFDRAPINALREIINKGNIQTIGGKTQIGFTNKEQGFHPCSVIEPVIEGKPIAKFSYQNIELTDQLMRIGSDFCVMPIGMP